MCTVARVTRSSQWIRSAAVDLPTVPVRHRDIDGQAAIGRRTRRRRTTPPGPSVLSGDAIAAPPSRSCRNRGPVEHAHMADSFLRQGGKKADPRRKPGRILRTRPLRDHGLRVGGWPVNLRYCAAHRTEVGAELPAMMDRMFKRHRQKIDSGCLDHPEQVDDLGELLT